MPSRFQNSAELHFISLQCTGDCCEQSAVWKVLYWRLHCSAESPEARDGQITLLSHQLQQKQPCHGQHNQDDDDHHHDGNDEDNYYDDPL